jgi:hypothetical protein
MEEMLTEILEKYAEKTDRQSQRNRDNQRKAYLAGKAEGLRLAKGLLNIIAEYGHSERGEYAEASRI